MKPEAGLVAVIFDNFGPYHRARLDGAARLMPVCGVELSGTSTDYAWTVESGKAAWEHRTLFPGRSCRSVPMAELGPAIDRLLDDIRPAVVAVPGWAQASSQLVSRWCMKRGVPAIVMSESCAHDEARSPARETVKRRLVGLHAAALVGGSAHVAYMRELGMPPDRIFTGYDAIDNGYFTDGAARARADAAALRVRYGLPERYFLASSRFIEKKNLFSLLEAFAACRADTPPAGIRSLVLLGDGVLAPAIQDFVRDRGLTDSVILPGFRQYPDLPAYYALADAFVHASTTEQWGLVVNEAMASGLPVLVSSRCGCAPDLVRHGENGFVFDPFDTARLTGFMKQMASGSLHLKAMGSLSAEIARGFGPESFGQGMLGAARCALRSGPPATGMLTRVLLRGLLFGQSVRPSAGESR